MANPNNLRPPFDSETGREAQKKSVRAKKRKSTMRAAVKSVLDQCVTDSKQLVAIEKAGLPVGKSPTYREFLVASIVLKTIQKGRLEDIEQLMRILGESDEKESNSAQGDALAAIIGAIGENNADK